MKIIKKVSNDLVLAILDDSISTETVNGNLLIGGKVTLPDSSLYKVIQGVESPGEFLPGELFYTNRWAASTLSKAKKLAVGNLKTLYSSKMEAGEISGINIGDIVNEIQDAAIMVTNSFSPNYAVVYDGNALVLNATKLASIYGYKKACSDNAQTLYAAINALTTIQEVEDYDLTTGWPSTAL